MDELAATAEVSAGLPVGVVVDQAHARAVQYVEALRAEAAEALEQFRRLPNQPAPNVATSDYQVLAALIEIGCSAGKRFGPLGSMTLAASERQLQEVAGLGSRSTVRKAKQRLIKRGWLSTSTGEADEAHSITLYHPRRLSATGDETMHTDCPNHVSIPSVVEGMNGSERVQSEGSKDPCDRGSILWSNKGLGDSGRAIYFAIARSPTGASAVELRHVAHRNTVRKKLRQLSAIGLIEKSDGRWRSTGAPLATAVESLGLDRWQSDLRKANLRERENYRRRFASRSTPLAAGSASSARPAPLSPLGPQRPRYSRERNPTWAGR